MYLIFEKILKNSITIKAHRCGPDECFNGGGVIGERMGEINGRQYNGRYMRWAKKIF